MAASSLPEIIKTYQDTLKNCQESQANLSEERVLAVLNARDAVREALKHSVKLSPESQKQLFKLDRELKKKAGQIVKAISLEEWRESLEPPEEAWWWYLETEAPPHLWDRWDWLWRGLTVAGWTVNLGLLADLISRFTSGGTGFAGAAAIALPSILTLLQAKSELTKTGQEGFDKLLRQLRIPKHFHEEARLATTLLLFALLIAFRTGFPTISNWYKQVGERHGNKGQLTSAEKYFKQALAIDPNNVEVNYNLGVIYEEMQEFEKAKMQYQLAVAGDFVTARNNLARLRILDGEPALAISLLDRGLKQVEAENAPIYLEYSLLKNLGWALLEDERENKAESVLEAAIALASSPEGIEDINNRASAHCLLAKVYDKQEQETKAIAQWKECRKWGRFANLDEDRWLSEADKRLQEE